MKQRFKYNKETPKSNINQELNFLKSQSVKYMFWRSKNKSYNIELIK